MSELQEKVARMICCGREDGDCGSAAHVACCAGDYMDFAATIIAAVREECAKVAETHGWFRDVEWWLSATKKEVSKVSAEEIAAAIRSQT